IPFIRKELMIGCIGVVPGSRSVADITIGPPCSYPPGCSAVYSPLNIVHIEFIDHSVLVKHAGISIERTKASSARYTELIRIAEWNRQKLVVKNIGDIVFVVVVHHAGIKSIGH